jgi:hypothetical protein
MNDKLVGDLYQKAYNECTKGYGVKLDNGQFVIKIKTTDMLEGKLRKKFAELLVEECCDQIREIDAMRIREHFGIED